MKRILTAIFLICLICLVGNTYAADVTYADKTDGGQFTAADANEIKAAVNSKTTGPASATDNAIPVYDGTTGKLLKGSGWTIDPTTGVMSAPYVDGSMRSELPQNTTISPQGGGVEEIYNEGGQIKVVEGDTEHHILSTAKVSTASKAADYTIGTDAPSESYGGTIYVTSAAIITAPAVVAGMNFSVVTIGDIAVSLDLNAADKMVLDGVTLADGDKATNSSKSGDTITCQYYSADGFYCWSGTVLGGHWTDGN